MTYEIGDTVIMAHPLRSGGYCSVMIGIITAMDEQRVSIKCYSDATIKRHAIPIEMIKRVDIID